MPLDLTSFDRRQLILGSAALLGAFLPGRAARGLPSAAAAEQVVNRLVEQVWQLLAERGDAPDIDRDHLLSVLDQGTDLSLLGRLVLGRYWRDASPGQRSEYLQLFRRYMLQTFSACANTQART
jgi:phospholipid transport system substrate-binding protein